MVRSSPWSCDRIREVPLSLTTSANSSPPTKSISHWRAPTLRSRTPTLSVTLASRSLRLAFYWPRHHYLPRFTPLRSKRRRATTAGRCHSVATTGRAFSSVEEASEAYAPVARSSCSESGQDPTHTNQRGGRRHPRCSDKTKLLKYLRSHAKVCKCCNCRNSHYPPILG